MSNSRAEIKKTFKLIIFGYCAIMFIVYAGQLRSSTRIPFIAPGEDE